ncbi:MAG TPA: DUF1116 domain-containing protein [Candidatus Saccharimonadales bacterium]|nr:DUF1116 domain-containing protein [Candidatus Saccharimonadales bacterium]
MDLGEAKGLFDRPLTVVNVGLAGFAADLRRAGGRVVDVDWRPPAGGDAEVLAALDRCLGPDGRVRADIAAATRESVERLMAAKPVIVGIGRALDTIPGMRKDLVLHAGPPVEWARMSGPTRGAVMGGLVYEGLADGPEEAARMAAAGRVSFAPCHHHQAVGPMAGIVTASMPVWIVENAAFGNHAFSTLNEGLGKVLRYGAYGEEVIARLRWMERTLEPILAQALASHGPLDLRSLIAQALQMGDEVHNRNRAATSLLIRALAPHLARAKAPADDVAEVLRFLDGNDHFFLNLSMAACKCALEPAAGIPRSSMISVMARNGTDFGIQVAGLPGQWFTAPAPMVEGLYLPGFTAADAAPDIGDSVITETAGLGGMAMAAAPAIVQFVGGRASQALEFTRRMYGITLAEHPAFKIPVLDFRGTATGIDLLKVVETGVVPVVNTGIAHKEPGVGMVGAGLVKPPFECFRQALLAFARAVAPGT